MHYRARIRNRHILWKRNTEEADTISSLLSAALSGCSSSSCKPTPCLWNATESCDSNSSTYDCNVDRRCFWGFCALTISFKTFSVTRFIYKDSSPVLEFRQEVQNRQSWREWEKVFNWKYLQNRLINHKKHYQQIKARPSAYWFTANAMVHHLNVHFDPIERKLDDWSIDIVVVDGELYNILILPKCVEGVEMR